MTRFKLGAFEQAIVDFEAVIAQDPKDWVALYGRGIAKLGKGDTAGGNADVAAAKAIKPDIDRIAAKYGILVAAART